jgi:hypothetical protein
MTGPTRADVMYALLALDAYNRSADEQNRLLSEMNRNQLSNQVGSATFVDSSDRIERDGNAALQGSAATGFSASYYTLNSKNVLAYRGTDFPTSLDFGQFQNVVRDIRDGWLSSFGVTSPEQAGPGGTGVNFQPYYALEFYDAVTGANRQLSLEEKRALIDAGQRVGELENQLANGREAKQVVESELPGARASLENIRPVLEAAEQAAATGIVGEVDTLEEAQLQVTLDSARTQFNYFNDQVQTLEANLARAELDIAEAEAELPAARADLAAKQPHDAPETSVIVGHSLGGSLAGYVGSGTEDTTRTFNEIPYAGMAIMNAVTSFVESNVQYGAAAILTALEQISQGESINVAGYAFQPFEMPDLSKIKSYRMELR